MSLPPECSLEATPLPVCFAQAQAAYHWVDGSSLGGADPALQQRVADGLAFAEKAAELVSSLSVFSANEELEDINTGDLKYLLLPFLRAELILRIQPEEAAGCHDVRLKHLRHAAALLEAFLRDLEARRALRAEARAGWEEACADRPLDAAASRTLKVSRLRAASRAKKALEALEARARGAAAAASADRDDGDEEAGREAALVSLEACSHAALDSLRGVAQEQELLEAVAAARRENGGSLPAPPPPPPRAENETLPGLQQLSLAPGSRIEMRAGAGGRLSYGAVMEQLHTGEVPGLHSLSVEEGMRREEAERAMAEAERLRQMGTREEARRAREEKGYDTEEEEEELRKARAKDDWRDSHTRGAGNRRNRS
mmetsp:Transcript_24718/g.73926  ORF Transcript_24718/g.73926 Transcript_24718/m.73926 type:complete len:371 (+) Transcript_24718:1-1113(+)